MLALEGAPDLCVGRKLSLLFRPDRVAVRNRAGMDLALTVSDLSPAYPAVPDESVAARNRRQCRRRYSRYRILFYDRQTRKLRTAAI
jgi:hypothetical protein